MKAIIFLILAIGLTQAYYDYDPDEVSNFFSKIR